MELVGDRIKRPLRRLALIIVYNHAADVVCELSKNSLVDAHIAQRATPQWPAGVIESRVSEIRVFEICAFEICVFEIRASEIRASEIRAYEIRAFEVRTFEIRAFEIRASEIRA